MVSEQEDAKMRLLAAAGPVFAEKGFDATTVREICQAADVNVAAINYYFGDKKTLYFETVRQAHGLLVKRVPMPQWPADAPPHIKLQGFVRTLLTRMLSRDEAAWQPRLMLREVLQPTEACHALIEDYFRPHLEILESIVREIVGEDLSAVRARQIAYSIAGQCLFYRVSGEIVRLIESDEDIENHYTIEQLAIHIASFSLAALEQSAQALEEVMES
ncbi:MAG: CerR family C-terminal domain-containing protein [Pirellulales bacterium]|nr:CerR family C-terminal domain-containing protein [Pirellulales bacterium]